MLFELRLRLWILRRVAVLPLGYAMANIVCSSDAALVISLYDTSRPQERHSIGKGGEGRNSGKTPLGKHPMVKISVLI